MTSQQKDRGNGKGRGSEAKQRSHGVSWGSRCNRELETSGRRAGSTDRRRTPESHPGHGINGLARRVQKPGSSSGTSEKPLKTWEEGTLSLRIQGQLGDRLRRERVGAGRSGRETLFSWTKDGKSPDWDSGNGEWQGDIRATELKSLEIR